MTAFICVRYENGKGDIGAEWGPVESIIIPGTTV
jgi:hypothetical protein